MLDPAIVIVMICLALVTGWFAHRDISRGIEECRAARACRRLAQQNSPAQNVRLIRACVAEMRKEYKLLPCDKFVGEVLRTCDRIDEWLDGCEPEMAEHFERVQRQAFS